MPVEEFKWQIQGAPAGRRNHKFTVYEQVQVPDEFGGHQKTYKALYTGWLGVRVTNAFENGEVRQQHDKETYYQLLMRYNRTLKPEHIIVVEHRDGRYVFAIEGDLNQSLDNRVVVVNARQKLNLDDHGF